MFEQNPMPILEFTKFMCNFEVLWKSDPDYMLSLFFPPRVTFQDAQEYKEEIFKVYPESQRDGLLRCMKLVEKVNKRVLQETWDL